MHAAGPKSKIDVGSGREYGISSVTASSAEAAAERKRGICPECGEPFDMRRLLRRARGEEWTYRDGGLVRENDLRGEISLGPGKPSHLFARTGRLPRFAAGNGDVDIEMLEVADFGLVIVHDDPDRVYAYTAGSDRLLGLVEDRGWTAASMRNDWKTVFVEGSTP